MSTLLVKNHINVKIKHVASNVCADDVPVPQDEQSKLSAINVLSIPASQNDSVVIHKRNKLSSKAKAFGFSPNEISKLMTYWNK